MNEVNETSEQEQTNSEETQETAIEDKFYSKEENSKESDEEKEKGDGESDESEDSQEDKEQDKDVDSDDKDESSKDKEDSKSFEKSDLSLPKETVLTEENLDGIVEFAKQQGLSKEQAQALIDRDSKVFGNYQQAMVDRLDEQSEAWMEELQKDKVFGGENLKANAEHARRALNKFGDDGLIQDLTKAKLGNHPGLSRMLMRIGQAMSEDSLIKGEPATKKKSIEEIFYGSNA